MDALGLLHLIDQPDTARSDQHLLHARIGEQADMRGQQIQGRHVLRIVTGNCTIGGPARRRLQAMGQIAKGRIELAALQAHQQVEDAAEAGRRHQGDLEPERGDLAEDHMIDDGLEAEVVALIIAFQDGEVDIVLGDAIALEQPQAIGEEAGTLLAMAAAIAPIEPGEAAKRGQYGNDDIPAQADSPG